MSSLILVPCCIISWIFTFVRLRVIIRQGIRKTGAVALHIWAMLLFTTIAMTFMIVEFSAFFNNHTFPGLSLIIFTSSFLISQYFSMYGILFGMNIPKNQNFTRWITASLGIELTSLATIYIMFFILKTDAMSFAPKDFPEVMLIGIASLFGIVMFIPPAIMGVVYFPAKKFTLMRLRTILMLLCLAATVILLSTRVFLFGIYIWQVPQPSILVLLTYVSLVSAILLFFLISLSNKLYAQFVITWRNIESWRAYRELRPLVQNITMICEPMGLPAEYPNFIRFLLDPEYYLYRAVIMILDGKVMLAYFLDQIDAALPEVKAAAMDERDELIEEAARIHTALQAVETPKDFAEIVETYRRVSNALFAAEKGAAL